jgi:hypothetical protein
MGALRMWGMLLLLTSSCLTPIIRSLGNPSCRIPKANVTLLLNMEATTVNPGRTLLDLEKHSLISTSARAIEILPT